MDDPKLRIQRTQPHIIQQLQFGLILQLLKMEGEVENQYKILIDSNQNIGLRYQAVFQLKNINTDAAILSIVKAYPHLEESVLLSHEVLYALGQLEESKAALLQDFLISVVENEKENSLSRHEAAEALSNYFLPQLPELYKKHLNSSCNELRWTCEISYQKVTRPQLRAKYGKLYSNTKQPAAPYDQEEFNSFLKDNKLQDLYKQKGFLGLLLREDIPLFQKYRTMYMMRNMNTPQVKKVLSRLLSLQFYKTQTSLLKHEICFILGQIGCQNCEHLVRECIENQEEQPIVRHEALAAVASQSKDAAYLDKFLNFKDVLIRESAQVAQFSIHYWND